MSNYTRKGGRKARKPDVTRNLVLNRGFDLKAVRYLVVFVSLMLLISGGALTALNHFMSEMAPASAHTVLGSKAPLFSLKDQYGRTHNLADYHGRPVVLAFYSEASPAVVEELLSLKKQIRAFDSAGAKIFGISNLSEESQKALHDKEKLPFPLLTDTRESIAKRYNAVGSDRQIETMTFVADATGLVMLAMSSQDIIPSSHGKQLLDNAACCFDPQPTSAVADIGAHITDFSLPCADNGQPMTLQGDKKQVATVVLFISSKCPCSRGYDQRIEALAKTYSGVGVRFVAVNSSVDESAADAALHARSAGYTFPVLKDNDSKIADAMHARVTPEAFLLDRSGILRYHGRIDDDRTGDHITSRDLQLAINAVVTGKIPPVAQTMGLGCAIMRHQPDIQVSASQ